MILAPTQPLSIIQLPLLVSQVVRERETKQNKTKQVTLDSLISIPISGSSVIWYVLCVLSHSEAAQGPRVAATVHCEI